MAGEAFQDEFERADRVHPFGSSATHDSADRGAGPASVHEALIVFELGVVNRTEAAAYAL